MEMEVSAEHIAQKAVELMKFKEKQACGRLRRARGRASKANRRASPQPAV
jgi:hypothetical protein